MSADIRLHVFGAARADAEPEPLSPEQQAFADWQEGRGELPAEQLRAEFARQELYRRTLEAALNGVQAALIERARQHAPGLQVPRRAGDEQYGLGFAGGCYTTATEASKLIGDAIAAAERAVFA